MDAVHHNEKDQRYIVQFSEGGEGELVYRRRSDVLKLTHSQTPVNRRGQGLGARLMNAALIEIEKQGLKVTPVCSYTQHYFDKNPQWAHLLV